MDPAEWMNERVREEIGELRRAYGFEEDEAVAYWHLTEARRLIVGLTIEDERDRIATVEEHEVPSDGGPVGQQIADSITLAAKTESQITQHFSSLYRELGLRVLRRGYPEGWTDSRI